MSSRKEVKNSGNAVQKEKKNKTSEEHLEAAMKTIIEILKFNENGMDTLQIASKTKTGLSYVAEVVSKGADKMEAQLREGYGMPAKDTSAGADPGTSTETVNTTPIDTVTETKAEKAARIKAEKAAAKEKANVDKEAVKEATKADKVPAETKAPKEKRTRENALLQALTESNGTGLTLEAVGAGANKILSITRKSWTGTLGAMKRANEITYNKETKLYNVP